MSFRQLHVCTNYRFWGRKKQWWKIVHGSLMDLYCVVLPVNACTFSVYLYLAHGTWREPNKTLGVSCARTFAAKDCGSVWNTGPDCRIWRL